MFDNARTSYFSLFRLNEVFKKLLKIATDHLLFMQCNEWVIDIRTAI